VTNSEVRKVLSDFSVIGRDILARTASHAANTAIRYGAEIGHNSQGRSASQGADATRERVATGAEDTVEYVFLVDLLLYEFHWFDREATDRNADADTKKSGLVGRFQNLKAGIRLDNNFVWSQVRLSEWFVPQCSSRAQGRCA
jgi:hypothetical protein